ncbi:hypothetical protein ACLB2K_071002 [Fragaria x ananassa]
MKTGSAVSAAHLLLQSVEATLPKQKKNLAVAEYKNAMVVHKRRTKARQGENVGHLPQDVLVNVFSFLDFQSLVSVGLVAGNSSSEKLKSSRGYCRHCKTIVWLDNMKCFNEHIGLNTEFQKIDPVLPSQVVDYLLEGSISLKSSSESDSDSDSEEGLFFSRLWAYAYQRALTRTEDKPSD